MASTFLQKFQGKMTTISKLGPGNTFKTTQGQLVYTNTGNSFTSLKINRTPKDRHGTEEYLRRPPSQISQQKRSLHLPSIAQRFLPNDTKHTGARSVQKGVSGYIDKETNWFIEDQTNTLFTPVKPPPATTSILGTQLNNIPRKSLSKMGSLKRNSSVGRSNKSGGLGPNIGGDQWQIRYSKQEKAMNYANQLRKVKRDKARHENQDVSLVCWNRNNHTVLK